MQNKLRRFSRGATIAAIGALLPLLPALADTVPPALMPVVNAGAHITYLGAAGGIDGYLITKTRPDGSVESQIAYIAPTGNTMVLGRAFDTNGHDISRKQLDRLTERMHEAQDGSEIAEPLDVDRPSRPTTGPSIPPPVPAPATAENRIPDEAAFAKRIASETASFQAGRPGAPEIVLIGGPSGPGPTAAWMALKEKIHRGEIRVTVVLTSGPGKTGSPRASAILGSAEPAHDWYYRTGSASDDAPIAPPGPKAIEYLAANDTFAASLPIRGDPVIAYATRAGQWIVADGSQDGQAMAAAENAARPTQNR